MIEDDRNGSERFVSRVAYIILCIKQSHDYVHIIHIVKKATKTRYKK